MKLTSTTNNEPEPGRKPHRLKIAAVLVATGTAIASVAGFTSTAGAADPVGSAAGYSVSAATNSIGTGAASVGAQLISWSNSVYASRALQPGFEEFQMSGTAGVSTVVTTGALKAAASTGGPTPNLFWIEGTHTLKSVNFGNAPSPLAVALGPAVPQQLLAFGSANFTVWETTALGAKVIPNINTGLGSIGLIKTPGATGTANRVALGPDGNVWMLSTSPGAGVDTIQRWVPDASSAVGPAYNFPLATADPSDIVAASDGGMWVSELGTGVVSRLDASFGRLAFTLPPGANAVRLVAGLNGSVWAIEAGSNGVSEITFSGGNFARTFYPSPVSLANLQSGVIGPDGNLWVHSAVAGPNRLIKFGTASTVTTSTLMTTTSSSTTSTTTSTTVTTVPPPRVCAKWQKRRVKVGKRKYVTQYVCIKFA